MKYEITDDVLQQIIKELQHITGEIAGDTVPLIEQHDKRMSVTLEEDLEQWEVRTRVVSEKLRLARLYLLMENRWKLEQEQEDVE